jgi:hypothetical protein
MLQARTVATIGPALVLLCQRALKTGSSALSMIQPVLAESGAAENASFRYDG